MNSTDTLAAKHLRPGEGRTVVVINDLVTFKAIAAETRGAYSLFHTLTPPQQGTPPHFQRQEDEAFFVLEGTYTFRIDDEQVELGPGGFAFIPRGTIHAYTNSGSGPARMLILVSPGGIHEQFFSEVGAHASALGTPPDIPRILAAAPKYGIEILPPGA